MPMEGGTLIRGREETQCLHIRAITTKVSKEIIIPRNEETSHKEHRGIMLLLIRGMLEEIIGIIILNTVVIMAKEQVDLMDREWVLGLPGMGRLSKGMEKVRGSHKLIRETTCKTSKGTIHLREIQTKVDIEVKQSLVS